MLNYLIYAVSISFISWVVGLILNAILSKTKYYPSLSYFNFIPSKKVNQSLGLKYFKWIVKNSFFKFFNQKIKVDHKQVDLTDIRKEMTYAEVGHLIGFIFVTGVAIYRSITTDIVLGIVIMVINVIMNLYPSLLQQENKRRIDRVIKRQMRK